MGVLAVINKPNRRVVHVASEMGVRIHTALTLKGMSTTTFRFYQDGFWGLLSMVDGNYTKEDKAVIETLDFMRNTLIREKTRRKREDKENTD